MRYLSGLFLFAVLLFASCGKDDETPQPSAHLVQFSVSSPISPNGRVRESDEPKSIVVTVKDYEGRVVADRREMPLRRFGESYVTESLTLESKVDNEHFVSEYMVLNAQGSVIYVAPREGSELAHLVEDPLDVPFTLVENEVVSVSPEVVAVAPDADPVKYGYAQFGFNLVKTQSIVVSPFLLEGSSLSLTTGTLYIEGLNAGSQAVWNYEIGLQAAPNTILIRQYPSYRLTAKKEGYPDWVRTLQLTGTSRIEIVFAQEGEWYQELWSKLYGGSKLDISAKTIPTSDGGVLVVGNTHSNDQDIVGALGLIDAWILKLDAQGNVQWSRNYGTAEHDDFGLAVSEYADGSGYAVAGFTRKGPSQSDKAGWLVKINSDGSIGWEKQTGATIYYLMDKALGGSENFMLVGRVQSNDATSFRQIDGEGNLMWERPSDEYPLYGGIKDFRKMGNAYVVSYNRSIYKLDGGSNIVWSTPKLFDDEADQRLPIFDTPEGYVVFGQQNRFNGKGLFGSMVRITSGGVASAPVPVTDPDDANNEVLYDVARSSSGNFVLIGQVNGLQANENKNFVTEITPTGTVVKTRLVRDGVNQCPVTYPVFFSISNQGSDLLVSGGANTACGSLPGSKGETDVWIMRIRL